MKGNRMDHTESQLPKDPETLERMKQDLRSLMVVRPAAQTTAEQQTEFADNLVSEIQMNGGFDELDVAIMLDSMAMLGYVLVEAQGENYASTAYLKVITE
jgi:hypothetical protein